MTDEAKQPYYGRSLTSGPSDWLNNPQRTMTPEPAQPAESPEARAAIVDEYQRFAAMRVEDAATTARPTERDGYATAFYQIAELLGITARPDSPSAVWEAEMLPRLRELVAAKQARPTERGAVEAIVGSGRVADWRGGFQVVWRGKEQRVFYVDRDDAHAALVALRTDAILSLTPPVTVAATDQAGEVVCAQCKGMRDDLAQGRDPEELCDPCYDDAVAALNTQPATGRTMGGEVFDKRPQCSSAKFGPEPSLRQMVRFYYGQHGQPDPDGDTEQYFAALQNGGE